MFKINLEINLKESWLIERDDEHNNNNNNNNNDDDDDEMMMIIGISNSNEWKE